MGTVFKLLGNLIGIGKDALQNKAKLKQLKRQEKRSKRASIREIKRDAEYIGKKQFDEAHAAQVERKEQRHKNYNDLQNAMGETNSLVRKGGTLAKGGGSQAFKPKKRILKRGNKPHKK